ncbi:conserved hypothetical protein [Xenorhabdus nematophila F1]|nr:conserved hypothetical protein [Xenorhabdus nematophila F1]
MKFVSVFNHLQVQLSHAMVAGSSSQGLANCQKFMLFHLYFLASCRTVSKIS